MDKIAFIDLEASGLGSASWPIEVGWCFVEGEAEAHLIAPAPRWSIDAWDERAEALHGISHDTLVKSGQPVGDVCKRLNAALSGATVYSDAPDWDEFWLWRLFDAGGARPRFRLSDFSVFFNGASEEEIHAAIEAATQITPHSHRAADDVLHMREIYRLRANSR